MITQEDLQKMWKLYDQLRKEHSEFIPVAKAKQAKPDNRTTTEQKP
jgi:hypothetical protein